MEYQIRRIVFFILIALVIFVLSIIFLPFALLIFLFLPAISWFKRSKVPQTKPKGTVEILPAENNEDEDLKHTLDSLQRNARDKKSGKKDKFRDL